MAAAGIGVGLQAKAVGAAATSKYGEKFKVGTGLRAARSLGRTAQRGFGKVTGVGPSSIDDQIKTQQAALSGKSEDAIRAACKRGNAGACAKLADSGDLDKEDFPAAMMTIPKNTAAGNKMQKAYEKKDPVGAVLGSDVAGRFANGTATQADKDKANKKENKDKLNDGLKKMNKDDYAKMSAEDFKAIKNSGVNMPINRSQLSAVADSSNTELQKEVSKHVAELANKETETDPEKKLNPGQQAVLKEARKAGVFKDPASTPPPDPNRHPDPLIGPSPRP